MKINKSSSIYKVALSFYNWFINRERSIRFLNKLIFRLDTTFFLFDKPKLDYQPLPWVGIDKASLRGVATKKRWRAICSEIKNKKYVSMKDIGSAVGFFCISASTELGMYSFGYDYNKKFLRLANYAIPSKYEKKCNFLYMQIDKMSVHLLPKTDVTLCLAIWHHWVKMFGLNSATEILLSLWDSTEGKLFFETGEDEVIEEFNLPFKKGESEKWLRSYFNKYLKNSSVEIVGDFSAGNYNHYEIKSSNRKLYCISRIKK